MSQVGLMNKRWELEDDVSAALDHAMPAFMWNRLSERERTRIVKEVAAELAQFCTSVQKEDDND